MTTVPSDARETMTPVQEIFKSDIGPEIPAPLLEQSPPAAFGVDDIPVDRYLSREFMQLEYEKAPG